MKNRLYILSFLTLLAVFFTSCEKKVTTEDNSRITYYVNLELLGDELIVIPEGGSFTDPGFTAEENGVDVSGNVVVTGTVDPSTMGYYPLSYAVENQDGFTKTASRDVFVAPSNAPDTDLTGTYTGQREGKPAISGEITIEKLGPGLFYCSDFFGGHYEFNAGYGLAYRMRSYFTLNSDNSLSMLTNSTPWGPWGFADGVYDPESKALTFAVIHSSGFSFNVTLTLEQ